MDESRQIIYVEIDEEITSIFDRIKDIRKKEILLVVPKKAVIFQSVVNLKILKSKLEKRDKKLFIVTTDRNGQHLAGKIDIPVLNRVEIEKTEIPVEESPQIKIQPIQARRNLSPKEESPQRFTEKKISIRELIQEFRLHDKKHKKSEDASSNFHFMRPSRKFLILIILISVGLFGLIGYIALPSATIYIRPKFDNITFTVNVTLADKRKNQILIRGDEPHLIASEVISTTTKQTKTFDTVGKEFKGVNAKGVMKIFNSSAEEWNLKSGTRFENPDGIIFRTSYDVIVPARTLSESGQPIAGSLVTTVVADPLDLYGKPVGDRGNIPAGKFTIPGLSKFNQRLVWGESDKPMTGGVSNYESVVSKEDIEAAKKQIQDNLLLMAKDDLRTYIDEVNKLNQTNLILLDDSRYLKTNLDELRIADDLEGSHKDKFEIFAQITTNGVAFDFDQLFELMKTELNTRTHPNMKLREDSISPDNITYDVIDDNESLGQIKITATVQGIEEYVIDSSTDAGIRFGDSVKKKILGMSISDAESIVGNLPEVDAVQIKTWPMWVSKIPMIPEGIDIKLMAP
jgi:hypothetical protein